MNDFGFTATTPDKKCGNDKERSQMAENLLQVNVFFQSLNVQTITEMPKYPVSHVRNCVHIHQRILKISNASCSISGFKIFQTFKSVVSSLGGALSLYLGISLAMLFELLELVIDIFIGLTPFCKAGKLLMNSR